MPEVRLIDANALMENVCENCQQNDCTPDATDTVYGCMFAESVKEAPTIEAEPVRHGRWIECDYKHLEHGFMETEPKAGLYCSECRAAFQKKKMTYKQYCAACGARMDEQDGGAENG